MIYNIEQELRGSNLVPSIEGDIERAFAQAKINLFHLLRAQVGLPQVELDREEPVQEAPVDEPEGYESFAKFQARLASKAEVEAAYEKMRDAVTDLNDNEPAGQ